MRSLLFWRKKQPEAAVMRALAGPPQPGAAPAAAQDCAEEVEATPAGRPLSLQRLVYAVALNDPRAADMDARPDPAQVQLMLEASATIARVGSEPRYTPSRPSLLPQIMEMLNDEDASLKALSGMVSQDPQLTGDLLRTANSPFYRVSAQPVESVDRATSLLGTQGIRMLVASRLLRPLAGADSKLGHFGEVLWDHSLYSASAAEAWAGRSQDADPFTAHLLALLHGVGAVAVYRVINDLYDARPGLERDIPAIAASLHANAAVTAARIAANWGLSERSRQALEAQSSAAPVGGPAGLTRALQFGLLAGAATALCRHRLLSEEHAFRQVEAGGFTGPVAARVWDRLVQAYIRH
jgi:HD-like signal output (HDOD) protein